MVSFDLNASVDWPRLLNALGIAYCAAVLPQRVRCPKCNSVRMIIMQDRGCGGNWTFCHDCSFAGDLFELAAFVWQLSLENTISKATQLGLCGNFDKAVIERYLKKQPHRRQRMTKLWESARTGACLQDSRTCRSLSRQFGLDCYDFGARWADGPGQLIGACTCHDVESVYHPSEAARSETRSVMDNRDRLFSGNNWDDVLLLPFYDLPGRITSFMLIGREGRPEDFVFRHAVAAIKNKPGSSATERFEGGLAFHPGVYTASATYDNAVVAVNDPLFVLRQQMRHFEGSLLPLPLLSYFDNDRYSTKRAWACFPDQKRVIWDPWLKPEAVKQAIRADGYLSLWGPRSASNLAYADFAASRQPSEMLRNIIKAAEPWHEVLSDKIPKMTNAEIERIGYMLKGQEELNIFYQRCGQVAVARLRELVFPAESRRVTVYNGKQVFETPEGWSAAVVRNRSPEMICDASLKINRVIQHGDTGTAYYDGVIRFQGQELKFYEPQQAVEVNTFVWMRNKLQEAGHGYMTFRHNWSKQAVFLATQFNPPEFHSISGKLGWDETTDRFVFPRFSILANGQVEPNMVVVSGNQPSAAMSEPQLLVPQDFNGPSDVAAAHEYWAIFVNCVANLLAPVFQQPVCGTILVGETPGRGGELVAKYSGCARHVTPERSNLRETPTYEHGWPTFVSVEHMRQGGIYRDLLLDRWNRSHNCIIEAPENMALLAAPLGGWNRIEQPKARLYSKPSLEALQRILPAYLQDLCRRKFELEADEPESWFDEVLEDFSAFAARCGCNHKRIIGARKVCKPHSESVRLDYFAELLRYLVEECDVQVHRDGFGKKSKYGFVRFCDNRMFIPNDVFHRAISSKGVGALIDYSGIGELITGSHIFRGEVADGWFIDEAFWVEAMSKKTGKTSNKLNVVG